MHSSFDASVMKNRVVQWIRDWFAKNGPSRPAVVGISGGKDSSVVAALCAEALGADHVVGVMMPNIYQEDIDDSLRVIEHLGILSHTIAITMPVADLRHQLFHAGVEMSRQACINLPARMRMLTLYAVSQSIGGRVANTCNLSEDWIGYSTRWGDGVGDFSPIARFTAEEVCALGLALGLPEDLVMKKPSDGLTGRTDEENFGFTYRELDTYIRTGKCSSQIPRNKIDRLHRANKFKLSMPESFDPMLPVLASDQ